MVDDIDVIHVSEILTYPRHYMEYLTILTYPCLLIYPFHYLECSMILIYPCYEIHTYPCPYMLTYVSMSLSRIEGNDVDIINFNFAKAFDMVDINVTMNKIQTI